MVTVKGSWLEHTVSGICSCHALIESYLQNHLKYSRFLQRWEFFGQIQPRCSNSICYNHCFICKKKQKKSFLLWCLKPSYWIFLSFSAIVVQWCQGTSKFYGDKTGFSSTVKFSRPQDWAIEFSHWEFWSSGRELVAFKAEWSLHNPAIVLSEESRNSESCSSLKIYLQTTASRREFMGRSIFE